MQNEEEKLDIKIPESTIRAMKEAQASYGRVAETLANIIPKLPKIKIPTLQLPEIPTLGGIELPPNPNIVREQNAWKRHKEILDIQNSQLKIQSEVLEEQKSNTKLTYWVLVLSIVGIIIAIISLIV